MGRRRGFSLPGRLRYFLVGGAFVGLLCFSVMVLLKNLNLVQASSSNNLSDVKKSQMTKLNLSLVYTGAEVDSTVNSTQSFTITDKYFIAVQANSGSEGAGWIVATDLANPSSTPAWRKKSSVIGHGNGTTWNSKVDQIVITDGAERHFFNADNGNFVKTVEANTSPTGIAYNKTKDQYIQTAGSSTTSGRILDNNFKSLMTFDAGHRLVNQDVGYYGGYIYRVAWGGCQYLRNTGKTDDANYCDSNFGEGSSVIYQFDMNGDFKKAFYIESGSGELESLDFLNGTMYLLFNNKPDSSHYSVYKVTNQNFKMAQTISFTNNSVRKTYGDSKFINTATTDGDGAVTYSSSDTSVASVNKTTGEVTINGSGNATITAVAAATDEYGKGTGSYTLVVDKSVSPKPSEINATFDGIAGKTLSTISFVTSGLEWADDSTVISLGENDYEVKYTKENDSRNYTTEVFTVKVNGLANKYDVIEGDSQVYNVGESETMTFRINADFALFEEGGEVYIDGKLVDKNNYTAESGSTIISLKRSYIDTISSGNHSLKVVFGDGGIAIARFAVIGQNSDTGTDPIGPVGPVDPVNGDDSTDETEDSDEDIPVPNTAEVVEDGIKYDTVKTPNTGDNIRGWGENAVMLPCALLIIFVGVVKLMRGCFSKKKRVTFKKTR